MTTVVIKPPVQHRTSLNSARVAPKGDTVLQCGPWEGQPREMLLPMASASHQTTNPRYGADKSTSAWDFLRLSKSVCDRLLSQDLRGKIENLF